MTLPATGSPAAPAVADGVNVDAVAATVTACAGVSRLDGGPYHQIATYLPGRTVDGVVTGGQVQIQIQIQATWGARIPQVAAGIRKVLTPLTGSRPVDVLVSGIDDPPGWPPAETSPGPARRPELSAGLPPG